MSGFTVSGTRNLIRTDLWSKDLKTELYDELIAMKYVRFLTDFPDGEQIHIPSLGSPEVMDYDEGQAVRYTSFDTGDFVFEIDQYKQAGTYITEKFKQDSYYAAEAEAHFVPSMKRALMEAIEARILSRAPLSQTASQTNTINGAEHRWVGSGANETLHPIDFAKARYALQKAKVPLTNLVAIVDPSAEYTLSTLTNLVNVSFNPKWEGIVRDGMSTGTRFLMNIYGWDVYVSDWLHNVGVETIGAKSVAAGSKANLFFSAAGGQVNPFVGVIRQEPRVQIEENKDLQRTEYVVTCRYGFGVYRPENLVVVLTDTDQVGV